MRRDNRSAIIEAAAACLGEHGFERTTTAAICARAGVSSGTFFHYFPTKLAVLHGLLEIDLADLTERWQARVELAASDPAAALAAWLADVTTEATDPGLAGFAVALTETSGDSTVATLLHRRAEVESAALRAVVDQGQRRGLWRTDRDAAWLATWLGVLADGLQARAIETEREVGTLTEGLSAVVTDLLGKPSA